MIVSLWVLAVLIEAVLLLVVAVFWMAWTRSPVVVVQAADLASVAPQAATRSAADAVAAPLGRPLAALDLEVDMDAEVSASTEPQAEPELQAELEAEPELETDLEPEPEPAPPAPTALYLDAADLEASIAAAPGGFGPDDLMQLQDTISSTQTKLAREAKGLDAVVARLTSEAAALTAAAAALAEILESEPIEDALRTKLDAAAPAVHGARGALGDLTPELEDLRSTLGAMSSGLGSYTAREWTIRQPTVESLNARIRAKLEEQMME